MVYGGIYPRIQAILLNSEIKPLEAIDAPEYFALIQRNEAYLDFPWVPYVSVHDLRGYIETREMYRICHYKQLVGVIEFDHLSRDYSVPHIELCFWVAYEFRNQGVMTSVLEGIFREKKSTFTCKVKTRNQSGLRVCQKVGMRIMYTDGGYTHFGK